MKPIIIIGTGLAGYQLAKEFRKLDQTTPLCMVTADEGRFYSKPLLSTALTNKKNVETLTTATAEVMAAQLNATIKPHSSVTHIDTDRKTINIGEETFAYEKLVLACGARTIKPLMDGDATKEILSVNDIHDYHTFQQALAHKKHITILGAGLIGCEFANDLSNAGYEVHVITLSHSPLDLLLPPKIGHLLQDALEKNGVHFHFGTALNTIQHKHSQYELHLSNGKTLQTDLVLSAIGLRPNTSLAHDTKIKTQRGFVVNRYLETNISDIYALGDCAEVEGHVLPYVTPLLNATRALAKTLTHQRTAVEYPAMPVSVKTPAHPIAVCPPPSHMKGDWEIEIQDNNVRALFYNQQKQLYGFILTNDAVKERMALAKQLPNLF